MNPFVSFFKALKLPEKTIWFLLLTVSVLAFGLLIPRLGFYWDDWTMTFIGKLGKAHDLWQYFSYDRPLSAWLYMILIPVLGTHPLSWHVYILLMRWLTTLLVWLTMRALWPGRGREAAFIALIFAVYPSFTQLPISVTYSLHWTQYVLYILSWWWMILARRGAKYAKLLIVLSLISLAASLSLSEYFVGLELLRPFILWKVLSDNDQTRPQRGRFFLYSWLPFAVVDALYVVWRTFAIDLLLHPGAARLSPKLFDSLSASPVAGIWHLMQLALPDIAQALIGTWTDTFQPAQFNFGQSISFISAAVALFAAALTVYMLTRVEFRDAGPASPDSLFISQAVLFGLAATVLGSAPAWVIERQATIGRFADRFALVAMLGASMALVGILSWFAQRDFIKVLAVGLLVMLGVNYHINITNEYRHAWERQQRFYWQLYWRIPAMKPGTTVIADSEVIPYAGLYASSLGVNLIYSDYEHGPSLDYWILTADGDLQGNLPAYQAGQALHASFRAWRFSGKSDKNIVISNFADQCFHLLGPQKADLAGAPGLLQPFLARSDLSRIILDDSQRRPMPMDVFGAEPEHTWCYFYEKGALAAQEGKWPTTVELGRQAEKAGFEPGDPWEWLVFVEANIHTGDFTHARDLTMKAFHQADLGPSLCELWAGLSPENSSSPDFQKAYTDVGSLMHCPP